MVTVKVAKKFLADYLQFTNFAGILVPVKILLYGTYILYKHAIMWYKMKR